MIKPVDYKQTDSKWKKVKYAVDGETSTIGSAGCGPTAMANVLAAIVSPYIDPLTCASWARHNKHNYKVKNSGTSYAYPEAQGAAYGVKVTRMNTTNIYGKPEHAIHQLIKKELMKGNWVIACMGPGIWTKSGHFIVVYGCENEYVYINDPASTKANRAKNTWYNFIYEVKYYWVVEVPEHIKANGIITQGNYTQREFVREVQLCIGAGVDEVAGNQTLGRTITVSRWWNRKHNVVLPLQKLLKYLGMYEDELDCIAGGYFEEAVNSYQRLWLNYKTLDGEITAKGRMWKSLLGML